MDERRDRVDDRHIERRPGGVRGRPTGRTKLLASRRAIPSTGSRRPRSHADVPGHLEIAIVTLFAILFGWVSAGFWTAIAGFAIVLAGHDRYAISATAVPDAPVSPAVRTAVVMPICNEDVPRVFAGLRAT